MNEQTKRNEALKELQKKAVEAQEVLANCMEIVADSGGVWAFDSRGTF